jgi:excisionase family DNA binding protein
MKDTSHDYPVDNRLMTTDEAAERLGVKDAYIKRMCRENKIRASKLGKFWRITEPALAEYIEDMTRNGKPAGLKKETKDRIVFHAKLRSQNMTPNSIDNLNEKIARLKADLDEEENKMKKIALIHKFRTLVEKREIKQTNFKNIPKTLETLADQAFPDIKDLVNEDPDNLEKIFSGHVEDEPEAVEIENPKFKMMRAGSSQ